MSQRTRSINTHTALGVCAAVAPTGECGSVRGEGVAATPRSEAVRSLRLPCVLAEVLLILRYGNGMSLEMRGSCLWLVADGWKREK